MATTRHYNFPLFNATDHPSWLFDWNTTVQKLDEKLYALSVSGADPTEILEILQDIHDISERVTFLETEDENHTSQISALQREVETPITGLLSRVDALEQSSGGGAPSIRSQEFSCEVKNVINGYYDPLDHSFTEDIYVVKDNNEVRYPSCAMEVQSTEEEIGGDIYNRLESISMMIGMCAGFMGDIGFYNSNVRAQSYDPDFESKPAIFKMFGKQRPFYVADPTQSVQLTGINPLVDVVYMVSTSFVGSYHLPDDRFESSYNETILYEDNSQFSFSNYSYDIVGFLQALGGAGNSWTAINNNFAIENDRGNHGYAQLYKRFDLRFDDDNAYYKDGKIYHDVNGSMVQFTEMETFLKSVLFCMSVTEGNDGCDIDNQLYYRQASLFDVFEAHIQNDYTFELFLPYIDENNCYSPFLFAKLR